MHCTNAILVTLAALANELCLANLPVPEYVDSTYSGIARILNAGDHLNTGCNFQAGLSPLAKTFYATLNATTWGNFNQCGRCISAGLNDSEITVMVLGQCSHCAETDIGLSSSAYHNLTSKFPISSSSTSLYMKQPLVNWKFVSCPSELISGNISFCLGDGSNGYYTMIQPVNFRKGVKSMEVNGISTVLNNNGSGYYFNVPGGAGKNSAVPNNYYHQVDIQVTSLNGDVLQSKISFALPASTCKQSYTQFKDPTSSSGTNFLQTLLTIAGGLVICAITFGVGIMINQCHSNKEKSNATKPHTSIQDEKRLFALREMYGNCNSQRNSLGQFSIDTPQFSIDTPQEKGNILMGSEILTLENGRTYSECMEMLQLSNRHDEVRFSDFSNLSRSVSQYSHDSCAAYSDSNNSKINWATYRNSVTL